MQLEKLFLTKQELPIHGKTAFCIPIHPKLLNQNIKMDESIPKKTFQKTAEEWYQELKEYTKNLDKGLEKEWIKNVFLKNKPKITKHFDNQILNGFWEDDVGFRENGLVQYFSISRNTGGTLYFREDDFNCKTIIPSGYIKFSEEKAKEFMISEKRTFIYAQHNVDAYPGALFLRNWAINYMNEVFKQIFL